MRFLRLLVLAVITTPMTLLAQNVTGYWRSVRLGPGNVEIETYYHLVQKGSTITGTVQFAWGDLNISDGVVNGDTFKFTAKSGDFPFRFEGTASADTLEMVLFDPSVPPMQLTATRVSGPGFTPPQRIEPPPLHEVADNGLVRTPPMGWNSWNHFHDRIDDKTVREIADAMVAKGMKDAGYEFIVIDDTWEGERDAQGNIQPNSKFPDMKALADYVHSKGLKLGIYSSPGPKTCGAYEGSYGHEQQDANTFAAWGIDYLKYDWCTAFRIYKPSEMRAIYQKMGDALRATGRPIVYSLCQYGMEDVWNWGPKVGGNLWRTTGDIQDKWSSMAGIGFSQDRLAAFAQPGHWNDPDMLEIGNGGMTADEYRTHMSLWAMLAAPLMAGNDLRSMDATTLAILTNHEVIAVNQDPLGKQARRIRKDGDVEYWTKPLKDGATALAIFNRSEEPVQMSVPWSSLGLSNITAVRDVWSHAISKPDAWLSARIASHGVIMLRLQTPAVP